MRNKSRQSFAILIVLVLAISAPGCLKDSSCSYTPSVRLNQEQHQTDVANLEAYLTQNNIQAESLSGGIHYVIHTKGTGNTPTSCNAVSVTYEGRLMSTGAIFDSTSTPVAFSLSNLIPGWQYGIPLIKEGGSITLYLPSGYAYGSNGTGSIPPNSNLIFDIELVDVI